MLKIYFPISSSGWAHVVCALYIPEVQFANVLTMEPIILQYVPHERYLKVRSHYAQKRLQYIVSHTSPQRYECLDYYHTE